MQGGTAQQWEQIIDTSKNINESLKLNVERKRDTKE